MSIHRDLKFSPFLCVVLLLFGCVRPGFSQSGVGQSDAEPGELVRVVADRVVRDHNPVKVAWNWGEGVLMAGMVRAYELTGEEQYLTFVEKWADSHRPKLTEHLVQNDYCGYWGPGFATALLYEQTGEEKYLEMSLQVIEYVLTNAARLNNGAFGHDGVKLSRQIWVDTAYMIAPLLSHVGQTADNPSYQREAVRQLNLFAHHNQDPETGLFIHMYDEVSDSLHGDYWARGNGWMVMSFAEVLKNEKEGTISRRRLIYQMGRLIQGLLAYQDHETGLWHTVVDHPDTYVETSGSAMILFGLAEIKRLDLFEVSYSEQMSALWSGLVQKVNDQGRVVGVSAGTGPGGGPEHYNARPRGTFTWGTGAFLLAATSYAGAIN